MSNENLFRVILIALSLWFYIDHHIIHRAPTVKKSTFTKGAGGIEFWVATTASLWTVALLLYASGFGWFQLTIPMPLWLRWIGVGAMAACAPLSRWTYMELGEHFTKDLRIRTDHQLIRTGPYRFVRHPMYATLFLCAVGTCLVTANYFVAGSVLFVAIAFIRRIQREDAMLLARFGDEYREYKKRTWALVPNFATLF